MGFLTAQYSLRGGREQNEDALFVHAQGDFCFAAVADGLGMHGGGDIAAQTVIQTLSSRFAENPTLDKAKIEAALNEANLAVLEKQMPACRMRSTVAMLLAFRGGLAFAHVGDSRVYHFRGGRIVYQSEDHSVSQAAVYAGEISAAQIRFHPDRNRLLRALGVEGNVSPGIAMLEEGLLTGDAFLLCTDGFWEYVSETEMEIDLAKSETPEQWASGLFGRIGKRIDGKNDNLSAAALFYTNMEEP